MAYITISAERYEELVAAERDANIIKGLLKTMYRLEYAEVSMLREMFGLKEE